MAFPELHQTAVSSNYSAITSQSPTSSKYFLVRHAEYIFLLALAATLLALWYWTVIGIPVSIWGIQGDWPVMSLAEAVNIDIWLREDAARQLGQPQFYQPGFWYQLTSYGIYRAVAGSGNARELFQSVVRNPDRYWAVLQVAPLFLTAIGSALVWRTGKRADAVTRCAMVACYFVSSSSLSYATFQYFNESFTLALAACFFPMALNVLADGQKRPLLNALACGLAASLLYLHKMNYVVWALALIPAFLAAACFRRMTWWSAILRSLLLVAGTAGGVLALGYVFLGSQGLAAMLISHRDIVLGSGIYGTGSHTVLALDTIIASAELTWISDNYTLILLGVATGWCVFTLLSHARDKSWLQRHLPESVLLFAAALAMLLALLKHYQPYYIVSVVAVFPFLLLWLSQAGARFHAAAAIGLTAISICIAIPDILGQRRYVARTEAKTTADSRLIAARTLAPDTARLWMYRTMDPIFGRLFLVNFSSIPSLMKDLAILQGPQLLVSPWYANIIDQTGASKDMKDIPWRSIVADKEIIQYIDKKTHPWVDDPTVKRTDFEQLTLFERDVAPQ